MILPAMSRSLPSRRTASACVIAGAAILAALVGCSGNGNSSAGSAGLDGPLFGNHADNLPNPSNPNEVEPLSLFEKRRLIARVTQDPSQLQRLTLRERRELAGMVQSVKHDQDKNDGR
jgi:hypothetical protein